MTTPVPTPVPVPTPEVPYAPRLDLASLRALDVHVHVESDGHGHLALDDELLEASAAHFRSEHPRTPTVEDVAEHYRSRSMAAVVFTVDARTATGHPPVSSEEIAVRAAEHADVLVPFGSVDPRRGAAAVEQAVRLVRDFGVRGIKLHPSLQAFRPDDRDVYPLYEAMEEAGAVVLFHTGQSGIGAGLPGGRGIKLRYSDPVLVDDVAADFPGLRVVLAHPGVPWADASQAIVTHKANVWMDLSGWSPRRLPPQLVRQLGTVLRRKVLFGSDFPLLAPDRWMSAFAELDVPAEAHTDLFRDNALRLLGLL